MRGPTIAIDAMGSDLGPAEIVAGLALALKSARLLPENLHFTLVGQPAAIEPALSECGLAGHDRVSLSPATEVIGMGEKPLQSLKQKKDSSMVVTFNLVREGKAAAALSCGNTGSLMAGGTLRIRPLPGVERPALATVIPTRQHQFVLLDAGANPEPTARQMVQNAILGSNFSKVVLGLANPRVGLLTIGTEEGKGCTLVNETHELLKECSSLLNYAGPIEGFQVFEDVVDVVVCDGFVGNIVLKVCESLFKMLKGYVRDELTANPLRMAGAFLARGAFQQIKGRLNPDQYAGAPLLGLQSPVFKAHGSSSRHAIAGAIHLVADSLQRDMTRHIANDIMLWQNLLAARLPAAKVPGESPESVS